MLLQLHGKGRGPVQTRSARVQGRGAMDSAQVHEAASAGVGGGGGALPFADRIQHAFGGFDVSGIQAHTGGASQRANEQMGSTAYATGNHVAFRGAPDLFTAAHEAAHVIQQRSGVQLRGGVGEVGDRYERHADDVASRVVQGRSAEDLLSSFTGQAPIQQRRGGLGVQHRAVQHTGDDAVCSPEDGPMTYASEGSSTGGGGGPGGGTATYSDQGGVGAQSTGGTAGDRAVGYSTADGGTLEAGRELEIARIGPPKPPPTPIPAVPGLFVTASGGVKGRVGAAISGLTTGSTERTYSATLSGALAVGIEYGVPGVASLYLRAGPVLTGGAQLKCDSAGVKQFTFDATLNAELRVGVEAGSGTFDYNYLLGRCNILRLVGVEWSRERREWNSFQVQPGADLVAAAREAKAAYERVRGLASSGVRAAGQVVSNVWNWVTGG
jgi:hypothetical protein